jgi:Holliday junction resolvase RusA-like endonuclease
MKIEMLLPVIGKTKKTKKEKTTISTNIIYAGVHFRTRQSHKNKYKEYTKEIFSKIKPIDYPVDIHFDFYLKKPLDSSNCSYMGKLLEDCLVAHGVLKDDNFKQVRKVSFLSHEDKEDKVTITVEKTCYPL